MLVNVYLDGALGKNFGKEWKLKASTPAEVLALIQANTGKLFPWIRNNLQKYGRYRVLATYKNGKREYLTQDSILSANNLKSIRFTPIVEGAGGSMTRTIVGAVLIVAGIFFQNPYVTQMGVALALSGVAGLLSPKQKSGSTNTSHYFQGIGRNQSQGNPVPLIYGQCKVNGVAISKRLSVDS